MNKNNAFKPAWWLKNRHLQTVFARYLGRRRQIDTQKEIFELPDGDFLDCRWVGGQTGPIILILHGLEGSIESHYAKGLLMACAEHGWRGVLVHFRSCGGELNRLPRGYHSGDTADLQAFVDHIQSKEPDTPIFGVGYSMGGNVLLKWLGETGEKNPLAGAVAVSVPFELHKAADSIRKTMFRLYEFYFLKPMKSKVAAMLARHTEALVQFNNDMLQAIRSVKEFDDKITAPMHGFQNGMDYYIQSSSRYYIPHIKIPTLIIHAKDDPFMTEDLIPKPYEIPESVDFELYDRGGHVGFISGVNPFKPEYWLEKRIPQFLEDRMEKACYNFVRSI